MADTKLRSCREIMGYILSFCMTRLYDGAEEKYPKTYGAIDGFVSTDKERQPVVGDLVLLSSCNPNKWMVSWLVETREKSPGWTEYLLESIEDGALCWWGNIGISYLPRRVTSSHEEWRWTDRQWAFKERWFRVCYKVKGAYVVRPVFPVFGEGFAVTLGTRTTHAMDDIQPVRSFPDWRKVTKEMMGTCYDECYAERDAEVARRKTA